MKPTSRKIVVLTLIGIILYTIPFIMSHEMNNWTLLLTDYINEILIFVLIGVILISAINKYMYILFGAIIVIIVDIAWSLGRHNLLNFDSFINDRYASLISLPVLLIGILILTIGVIKELTSSLKKAAFNSLFDQTNRAFYFEYNYINQTIHIDCTDAFVEHYSIYEQQFDLSLKEFLSYVHPDDQDDMRHFTDKSYQFIPIERYYRIKFPLMDEYIWIYSKSVSTKNNEFTSVEIDFSETQQLITTMNEKDKLIKYNKQDLDFIMNHSNDFIVKYNKEGKLDYASESFLKFFDIDDSEILGKTYQELDEFFQIEEDTWFVNAMKDNITTDLVKSEFRGKTYWISWHNHTVTDENGEMEFLISIGSNLTEMMNINEKLDFDSKHDSLTKLLNRRGLYTVIENLDNQSYTLFFINIHHFMTVNDYYGSDTGDYLIIQIARTLEQIHPKMIVSRYEGDEFILVAKSDLDINKIIIKFSEIQDKVYHHDKIQIPIQLHIGYAKRQEGEFLSTVITNAALAMTQSRQENVLKIIQYQPAMGAQLKEKILIIEKLKKSISHDAFEIHSQGIFDCNNQKVMIESLARWYDKDIGYISPQAFFQVAKDASMIFDLDYYLITKSIEQFSKILKKHPQENLLCCINFTMETLFQDDIINRVAQFADSLEIPSNQICVEITESTFVKNVNILLNQIQTMKEFGFLIAIDDFGKEYSSLSLIKSLDVDIIKIDKAFIRDLEDQNNLAIIKMVLEIARIQQSKVVVEGIESQKQYDRLKEIGCDYFQGYHLERPHNYLKHK